MIGIKLDPISLDSVTNLDHSRALHLPQVTAKTTVRCMMVGLQSATGIKMLIDWRISSSAGLETLQGPQPSVLAHPNAA